MKKTTKTVKAKKENRPRKVQAVSPPKKTKPVSHSAAVAPAKPAAKPAVAAAAAEAAAPKKLKLSKEDARKYRTLLLELRDHVIDGVSFLATDNLKRSHRDASGELSGYSLHMADAGTDNFDREFALSLVSSEQEALYEIEEALKRLEQGNYGLCDMCEKAIRKERLEAVPFARLCVHCQSSVEREKRGQAQPASMFGETADEEGGEGEESEE